MAKACSMPSTWARSDPMGEAFEVAAEWYDGINAVRHSGELTWDGRGAFMLDGPTDRQSFAATDLRFGETRPGKIVYRRDSVPDFRLILPEEIPPGLAARLPAKSEYGAWVDRLGLGKAVAIFGVVSAAAVALFMTTTACPVTNTPTRPCRFNTVHRALMGVAAHFIGGRWACHTTQSGCDCHAPITPLRATATVASTATPVAP